MGLKQFEGHPIRALVIFRLAVCFIVLYMIDLEVYKFVIGSHPTDLQAFLTSPFSPYEDYTKAYSSPQQGAFYNLGVVTIIILFTDIYLRILRPSRLRINPATAAFALSVATSWVLSGLEWTFKTGPSAGTSIIGSCMLLTLFACSGRDLVTEGARRRRSRRDAPLPIPFIPIVFSVVSVTIYVFSFILSSSFTLSSSFASHLFGDSIFISMIAFFLIATSDASTIAVRRKEYLFATMVFLLATLLVFGLTPLSYFGGSS